MLFVATDKYTYRHMHILGSYRSGYVGSIGKLNNGKGTRVSERLNDTPIDIRRIKKTN